MLTQIIAVQFLQALNILMNLDLFLPNEPSQVVVTLISIHFTFPREAVYLQN